MRKIYSSIEHDQLLHQIFRRSDFGGSRIDISSDSEGLQVAALSMEYKKTFRPHYHVPRERTIGITQETWIVIEGTVGVLYYDIDGSVLANDILMPGDCTITFRGGHNYECLSENSIVYEVKTGPFVSVVADKEYLD